jgi:para-nitrobenzyl esterase
MVWIHGGALITGLSDIYDPTTFVEQGMVVVTINYRIGALGFMAHPALSAESPEGISGNYGLKDQQAALRWVQKNIRRFGGDPDNVTIFGESAGGYSVHAHLASPGSAGLFHRAIVQSGAYQLQQPSQADFENLGLGIAAAAGCSDQDAACLRSLPVETVLENQDIGAIGYSFVVDGVVLPMSVGESFYTGMFNQVPVMEGTTHDEWSLFVALLYDLNPEVGPVTLETYPNAIADTLGIPIETATAIRCLQRVLQGEIRGSRSAGYQCSAI